MSPNQIDVQTKMVLISDNIFIEISIFLSVIAFAVYQYAKYHYSYWKRRGITQYTEPNLIFGNLRKSFTGRESFVSELKQLHDAIKGPFGGVYLFTQPTLFIKDPTLIKQILIKDFDFFVDRGTYVNEKDDPLTGHLFSMPGERWRFMRNKLSPTFTSGKLKQMINNFAINGQRLQNYLETIATSDNNLIEARNVMSRYTIDSITLLAFGIETDCINNTNEKFFQIGQRFSEPPLLLTLKQFIAVFSPRLMNILKFRIIERETEEFIRVVTEQSLNLRENEKIVRRDFMQLIVQLRNADNLNSDGSWDVNVKAG